MEFKKRMTALAVFLVLGAAGFWYGFMEYNAKPLTDNNLIRLHVLANSDSVYDQKIKLLVRDEVIKYMTPYLKDVKTNKEARKVTEKQLPGIKNSAENSLASLGLDYQALVELGDFNFPTKSYGDLVLPSGKYEAVRIVLGKGEGKNWWCVLYPPLCFIDISSTIAVSVRDLPEDGAEAQTVNTQPAQVVIKFKIWEEMRTLFEKMPLAKAQ